MSTVSVYNALGTAKRSGDAVLQARDYMNKAAVLDGQLSERNAAYGRVSSRVKGSKVGQAAQRTIPMQNKVFGLASDVVTVAGLGLSAVALPNMAKKTATSARELVSMFNDPTATTAQKLDKAETLTRSAAGTIFSAQGVYLGAKGTLSILSRFKPIGSLFENLGNVKFLSFMKTHPVGRALGALLPIADGAVFIGEAIATNRTLKDPLATPEQKARKVLDLGLAGIKTAFWLLPGARFLKTAYSIANYGQLGLTIWDFRKTLGPKIVDTVKNIGWGITHPKEGLAALGNAIKNGATGLFSTVGGAFTWLFQRIANPVETWNAVVNGARTLNQAAKTPPSATPGELDSGTPAPATPAVPVAPAAPVAPAPVLNTPVVPVAPVAPVEPVTAPVTNLTPATPVATAPTDDAAFQAALSQIEAAPTLG